jgi:hypothetical protein
MIVIFQISHYVFFFNQVTFYIKFYNSFVWLQVLCAPTYKDMDKNNYYVFTFADLKFLAN